MSDDFYIGYQKRAAPTLGRFLRRIVLALLLVALAGAAALSTLQGPFDPGTFEYGKTRTFEGTIAEHPYPRLLVEPPGAGTPVSFHLVTFGKHGAAKAVAGLEGQRVRLEGTLIHRGDQRMVEIADGTVVPLAGGTPPTVAAVSLGRHTLRGEIVDSKCYLGVMKPGRTKPHRACASLCIRGGIPPLLRVESASGEVEHLLLVGKAGEPIGDRISSFLAEPVAVTGDVERRGDLLVLLADAADIHRTGE